MVMTERVRDSNPERSPDPILELSHVSKYFRSVRAVNDVSLQLHRGEVTTLLGPSGCGKTTTLRMVVGLERLSEGEIRYRGTVVDSAKGRGFVPTNKRNMGMVFQSYAIWPHMTVFENVAYPLKIRRVNRQETRQRVRRALDLVGMPGLEDRPATMLSGGQQQRVAVARSLVSEPDILLMDEPFSNLDAKLREQMRVELRSLQQRLGITVLFVTHDQIEALSLSDRVVVMNLGRIEQIGTPRELYRQPETAVVRDFIGRAIVFHALVADADQGSDDTLSVRLKDGGSLAARGPTNRPSGLHNGSDCTVACRPESLRAESADSNTSLVPNTLRGTVRTLLFLGERFEARIELSWGQEIVLYLPATDMWHEGQKIVLTLDPDQLQVWPVAPTRATDNDDR